MSATILQLSCLDNSGICFLQNLQGYSFHWEASHKVNKILCKEFVAGADDTLATEQRTL